MQQTSLNIDGALRARLTAYRQTLLRADTQPEEAPLVYLPDGEPLQMATAPGPGLRASGMLLAYALLGHTDATAEAMIAALEQTVPERQMRRLCTLALSMLHAEPDFSLPNLLACLRTAISYLPGEDETCTLPGMLTGKSTSPAPVQSDVITARCAFAGNAAIVYITLPAGAESAEIEGQTYTKEQCRAGICIAANVSETTITLDGRTAVLKVNDPLRSVRFRAGFRFGRLFLSAARTPRPLWKLLPAWLRISAPPQTRLPVVRLTTSCGERQHDAMTLAGREAYLRCPSLDPRKDKYVILSGAGVRYIELTEEG